MLVGTGKIVCVGISGIADKGMTVLRCINVMEEVGILGVCEHITRTSSTASTTHGTHVKSERKKSPERQNIMVVDMGDFLRIERKGIASKDMVVVLDVSVRAQEGIVDIGLRDMESICVVFGGVVRRPITAVEGKMRGMDMPMSRAT